VTLCPHCYHTLKQEYPRVAAEFFADYGPLPRVFHATEYALSLLVDRRLELAYPEARRIAFHDPCYLGRINGVLDPPRKLLGSLPGVHFTELERHGQNGFCCGGGGGRLWLAEHQGRRINQLRAEEVLRSGAEVLATACPYCLTMLEDGVQAVSAQNPPPVVDLLELAARSLASPSCGESGSEGV
jgi:Fe-S oxidoreductase